MPGTSSQETASDRAGKGPIRARLITYAKNTCGIAGQPGAAGPAQPGRPSRVTRRGRAARAAHRRRPTARRRRHHRVRRLDVVRLPARCRVRGLTAREIHALTTKRRRRPASRDLPALGPPAPFTIARHDSTISSMGDADFAARCHGNPRGSADAMLPQARQESDGGVD
jgi:hypothetical protein